MNHEGRDYFLRLITVVSNLAFKSKRKKSFKESKLMRIPKYNPDESRVALGCFWMGINGKSKILF